MNTPHINVTPLIDVLLVLLIIFMVVTPLKPAAFKSKIPAESNNQPNLEVNIDTLLVRINADGSLMLNNLADMGSVENPDTLSSKLRKVFELRLANLAFIDRNSNDPGSASPDRIERTVFIKAPRSIGYGKVARVIDAVKQAGAVPISLQVDALD